MRRKKHEWLTIRTSLQDEIDQHNPPPHLSCDWLNDPLAHGLLVFPPEIYKAMHEEAERRKHGNPNSEDREGPESA